MTPVVPIATAKQHQVALRQHLAQKFAGLPLGREAARALGVHAGSHGGAGCQFAVLAEEDRQVGGLDCGPAQIRESDGHVLAGVLHVACHQDPSARLRLPQHLQCGRQRVNRCVEVVAYHDRTARQKQGLHASRVRLGLLQHRDRLGQADPAAQGQRQSRQRGRYPVFAHQLRSDRQRAAAGMNSEGEPFRPARRNVAGPNIELRRSAERSHAARRPHGHRQNTRVVSVEDGDSIFAQPAHQRDLLGSSMIQRRVVVRVRTSHREDDNHVRPQLPGRSSQRSRPLGSHLQNRYAVPISGSQNRPC